jgi:hypothetical protein
MDDDEDEDEVLEDNRSGTEDDEEEDQQDPFLEDHVDVTNFLHLLNRRVTHVFQLSISIPFKTCS